jgi:hypothetical protein
MHQQKGHIMQRIASVSEKKLRQLFTYWNVPGDFADPIYNYLVYGYGPGSFFTSVLANDWHNAIVRSHPSNSVEDLKNLAKFTINCFPPEAWGSQGAVDTWSHMEFAERRAILERKGLIYSEKQETFKIIKESA